jgi:hypothetical protein
VGGGFVVRESDRLRERVAYSLFQSGESQPCFLLSPVERQPRVIQEFADGELWWMSSVKDCGDDVGHEESEVEKTRDIGRDNALAFRDVIE